MVAAPVAPEVCPSYQSSFRRQLSGPTGMRAPRQLLRPYCSTAPGFGAAIHHSVS
jgi:hypothetical protein